LADGVAAVDWGGLGFGYKWNMGWMHDTLDYISKEPIHRRHHHGNILFGLHYAFSENFVLPLSHDEVVHGKRSILGRMPGDEWQRFANLRALLRLHVRTSRQEADVHGLRVRPGHGMGPRPQPAVAISSNDKTISACSGWFAISTISTARTPALHQLDCDAAGFEWLVTDDANHSVFAWLRKGSDPKSRCVWSPTSRPRSGATTASACRSPANGAKCSTPMLPIMAAATQGTQGLCPLL